jgi:hypothetical protein
MVAVSVPIWDEKHEKVIAVLSRTAHLTDLLDDYASVIRGKDSEDVNRVIALVDRRDWKILDHPWMTTENLAEIPEEQLEDKLALMKVPFPIVDRLAASEAGEPRESRHLSQREEFYEDPAAAFDAHYGGTWLAAFASVGRTRWTAVVQERRAEALRPVDRVHDSLARHGVLALVVSCTLIPMVWYFVMRGLNESPSRRSGHRGGSGTLTTTSSGSGST